MSEWKTTEWIPNEVRPVRPGVYQRASRFRTRAGHYVYEHMVFARWSGDCWCPASREFGRAELGMPKEGCNMFGDAMSSMVAWRGITADEWLQYEARKAMKDHADQIEKAAVATGIKLTSTESRLLAENTQLRLQVKELNDKELNLLALSSEFRSALKDFHRLLKNDLDYMEKITGLIDKVRQ